MLFAVNTLSYYHILDFSEFSELSKMEKIVLKDFRKMLKLRQYLPKYSRIIPEKANKVL